MHKQLLSRILLAVAMVILWTTVAQAVTMDYVTIGNPGNAADNTGYGAVGYSYQIGTYEVTTGQYCEFLNAKAVDGDPHELYNHFFWDDGWGCKIERIETIDPNDPFNTIISYEAAAEYVDRPVRMVSFWDACRFVNWMHNGQGDGDTEDGAYTLDAPAIANNTVTRNQDAKVWIPNQDEWYKAAYYDGGQGVYYDYPTSTDVEPTNNKVEDPDPGNRANFWTPTLGSGIGYPYYFTEVGEYENSASPNGTFDQGGNAVEWNEDVWAQNTVERVTRGGALNSWPAMMACSNYSHMPPDSRDPTAEGGNANNIGFRVARLSVEVPPAIPGDTNNDQKVDGDDAATMALYWGQTGLSGGETVGDFNADGSVNMNDASILAANWGDHTESAGAVPEPSVVVLLVGMLLAVASRRSTRL